MRWSRAASCSPGVYRASVLRPDSEGPELGQSCSVPRQWARKLLQWAWCFLLSASQDLNPPRRQISGHRDENYINWDWRGNWVAAPFSLLPDWGCNRTSCLTRQPRPHDGLHSPPEWAKINLSFQKMLLSGVCCSNKKLIQQVSMELGCAGIHSTTSQPSFLPKDTQGRAILHGGYGNSDYVLTHTKKHLHMTT